MRRPIEIFVTGFTTILTLFVFQLSANSQPSVDEITNDKNITDGKNDLKSQAKEIAREVAEFNNRPRKIVITRSTKEVGYKLYFFAVQVRVEKYGNSHFPEKNGKRLYGNMVVTIPVQQDGSIYNKEGGPRIERGSGNSDLDAAALSIVRRAAPFGAFPKNLLSSQGNEVWELIYPFKFAHEELSESPSAVAPANPTSSTDQPFSSVKE